MASATTPYNSKQITLFALFSVLATLATTAVGLRIWSRRLQNLALRPSDYVITAGLFFTISHVITIILAGVYGSGKHIDQVSPQDVTAEEKIFITSAFPYFFSTAASRASILLLYTDIFASKKPFRRACWVVLGVVCVFLIVEVFITAFGCVPYTKYWDVNENGKCINLAAQQIANAVINVVLDMVVIALPQRVVWRLRMATKRKVQVSLVFSLGIVVIVMTILRLEATIVNQLTTITDIPQAYYPSGIYGGLETTLGVVSACLPTLGPVLRLTRKSLRNSLGSYGSSGMQVQAQGGLEPYASQRSALQSTRYEEERDFMEMLQSSRRDGTVGTAGSSNIEPQRFSTAPFPNDVVVTRHVNVLQEVEVPT